MNEVTEDMNENQKFSIDEDIVQIISFQGVFL